jgi:RND family efflux transporter MFP subunit
MIVTRRFPRVTRWSAALPLVWLVVGCDRPEPKASAPPPQVVFVSNPTEDDIGDFEDFTGRTDAIYSVEVRARVTGYLEKVLFKDGDEVKEGEPLFNIDDRPYKAELNRTEASLAQSEAHLKRLELDYGRASNLNKSHNISREEYDRIAGDRSEAEASVAMMRAQFDLAKLNVAYTKITAPIAGRLSRRQVDPGNLIKGDETTLTTIKSQDPLYVYFDIDERTLLRLRRLLREGKIQSYQQAKIPVLVALSDESNYPHKGEVDFRENAVDPGTGTLRARARIDNPPPYVLTPGLFVRVRLPVGSPQRKTLVAEKALGSEQGEKYLYVVRDKVDKEGHAVKVAEKVRVEVGRLNGDRRVIERVIDKGKTIGPNDLVIVEGLQRVRPDAVVVPKDVSGDAKSKTVGAPSPATREAVAQAPPKG